MNNTQKNIIKAAIRAPSGDNCQPWWFKYNEDGQLQIGIDPARAKSFFDFKMCGTLLSLGAVLENIRTQAANEGFFTRETHYDLIKNQLEAPLVSIEFINDKSLSVSSTCITAINTRTVNRRPYLPFRMKDNAIQWMKEFHDNNTQVHTYTSRRDIKKWAQLIYLADRIRYSHPAIHEDVFSKILLTTKEAQIKRMGLEIDRLGAGPLAGPIIRLIKPWDRLKRLSIFGVDNALAYQSKFTALMTGAMVLVTIPSDNKNDWINAGKSVQKLWNTAHEKKLCIHPMTVALYIDARFQDEGNVNFLPSHIPLLEKIKANLSEIIPNNRTGAMLFRIGYGFRMKTPAIRLPEESFIKT